MKAQDVADRLDDAVDHLARSGFAGDQPGVMLTGTWPEWIEPSGKKIALLTDGRAMFMLTLDQARTMAREIRRGPHPTQECLLAVDRKIDRKAVAARHTAFERKQIARIVARAPGRVAKPRPRLFGPKGWSK